MAFSLLQQSSQVIVLQGLIRILKNSRVAWPEGKTSESEVFRGHGTWHGHPANDVIVSPAIYSRGQPLWYIARVTA
jgi:hypothetical protein